MYIHCSLQAANCNDCTILLKTDVFSVVGIMIMMLFIVKTLTTGMIISFSVSDSASDTSLATSISQGEISKQASVEAQMSPSTTRQSRGELPWLPILS